MFKTPLLCDRRVYDKLGKWRNPNEDRDENIFYFIKENETLVPTYVNGREELKAQITIVIFGCKPIANGDYIILTNKKMRVVEISPIYIETSIYIKDLLKDRVGSMQVVLQ